ncbi:hypothetical protein SH467x_000486 [Pirellulaceae bacterium SH467]
MNKPPNKDKDEDERFMPADDPREVVQTPFDRLLSRTLMQLSFGWLKAISIEAWRKEQMTSSMFLPFPTIV